MLCATLRSDEELRQTVGNWQSDAFIVTFISMLGISIIMAYREARWEWAIKASPKVGDLIEKCHPMDSYAAFLSLVIFTFFAVQMQVKDIVIMLHPWKSVQHYAAFKLENARAYLVGYKDANMFYVENLPGQSVQLPMQIAMKGIVFMWKCYMLLWTVKCKPGLVEEDECDWDSNEGDVNLTLLVSVFSSTFSIMLGLHKLFGLYKAREVFWNSTVDLAKAVDEQGNPSNNQREAGKKLLAQHFKWWVVPDAKNPRSFQTQRVSLDEFKRSMGKGYCSQCGRPEHDLEVKAASSPKGFVKKHSLTDTHFVIRGKCPADGRDGCCVDIESKMVQEPSSEWKRLPCKVTTKEWDKVCEGLDKAKVDLLFQSMQTHTERKLHVQESEEAHHALAWNLTQFTVARATWEGLCRENKWQPHTGLCRRTTDPGSTYSQDMTQQILDMKQNLSSTDEEDMEEEIDTLRQNISSDIADAAPAGLRDAAVVSLPEEVSPLLPGGIPEAHERPPQEASPPDAQG
eukprot:gnl/TRDRNA2_/TRDRNA2_172504_c1_seq3.p1 gnl/TRDRNA2_/TRDRNA2_172504_c1~~gnl/TRDRNA2_/TRDRNA2_172504_c1_seq3.p1  ORF type:complete len:599 (+),score=89.31 gnl/TRDRNA2_/TRDRNA2_172504_c1_seq3:256-1797(+)